MGQQGDAVCNPQPETTSVDTEPVHRVVCLFTTQLSLLLILPAWRDGQAELTWVVN